MSLSSPAGYNSPQSFMGAGPSGQAKDDNKVITGWAQIKEDGIKSFLWTKKYLVLREYTLEFNKSETATTSSLTIPLKDIISVNRVEIKPYCFEIVRVSGGGAAMTMTNENAARRTVLVAVKSDAELYSWIDEVYQRCPSMGGVSNPTGFTHKVHVGFDPVSGGFTGLPDEWEKLLTASAITREDYAKNPQAVIEVLEFYDMQKQGQDDAFGGMMNSPPGVPQHPKGLQGYTGNQMPNFQPNIQPGHDARERERREQEQMERDAARDREFEKQQREAQMLREKAEQERLEREREEKRIMYEREQREREREREEQRRAQEEYSTGEDYGERQRTDQQPIMMGGGEHLRGMQAYHETHQKALEKS